MRRNSLLHVTLLLACSAISMTRPAVAADSDASPVTAVELVLVGQLASEPSLFGRVKSLFEPNTRLEFETAVQLDPNAILKPELRGKLYVWITLRSNASARVYVAVRDPIGNDVRYLYRDVQLESGLDEVGVETLAQIAHSSSRALWAHEQQMSASALLQALQSEPAAPLTPVERPLRSPVQQATLSPNANSDRLAVTDLSARAARVGLSAAYAVRMSGAEGWIHEPGAMLAIVFKEQFSIRLGAAYAIPHRFDAPLTRVKLEGFSSEVRVGWKTRAVYGLRGHMEAGIGIFLAHWTAESNAPAESQPGQYEPRGFALSSLGLERSWGPLTFAARAQLRIPFQATNYEVIGNQQYSWKAESWLSPGLAFDVGGPLD
jgi:hypothetical protein